MEIPVNIQTATPSEPCSSCVFHQTFQLLRYGRLIKATQRLQSPLLLAIRLYWGWQFFLTGRGKLMNPGKVAEFFQSLHIPFPAFNVYLAGGTECFGGLLLLEVIPSNIFLATRTSLSAPTRFSSCWPPSLSWPSGLGHFPSIG